MNIDELINNMEMPDVRPIDIIDDGIPAIGHIRKLAFVYAFLQSPILDDGDVSFVKETDGEEVFRIRKCDLPKTVTKFIGEVAKHEGHQFHAYGIVKKKLQTVNGEEDIDFVLSLASESYEFMSALFTNGSECGVYFHAGCMPDKKLVDKIVNETLEGYRKLYKTTQN